MSEPTELEEREYYYAPLCYSIRADYIRDAEKAIQIGLRYAEDALALLERSSLTPYVKDVAEHTIQQQLDKMHAAQKQLAEPNGSVID